MKEKFESIHIEKRVAGQQQLAEVAPDANISVSLLPVDGALLANEIFRSGKFVGGWRAVVGQFECVKERGL